MLCTSLFILPFCILAVTNGFRKLFLRSFSIAESALAGIAALFFAVDYICNERGNQARRHRELVFGAPEEQASEEPCALRSGSKKGLRNGRCSGRLRCLTLESGFKELRLDLVRHPKDGIGIAYGNGVLTAKEFANITMQMMVRKVRGSAA
jgi:hypothetical protein